MNEKARSFALGGKVLANSATSWFYVHLVWKGFSSNSQFQNSSLRFPLHPKVSSYRFGIRFQNNFFVFQQLRTVLSCTNPVKESAVFTQSTLMVQVPLMCSVTKQQTVGGGQYCRRDWTVPLISIATGTTIKMASVTWMTSFGWDWTRYIAWPTVILSSFEWI